MAADLAALLRSPLYDRHVALGAKMADFGGWSMPIEYPGGGVLKEHAAVRGAVGVFDVSHLGKLRLTGTAAKDYANSCLTNDLDRLSTGQAQYTLCCDDASGGVVDDLLAYYRSDDDVFLVPNAANSAEVGRRLAASAPAGTLVENLHERFGVIAVQGPRSADVLREIGLPTDLPYMSFVDARWRGAPIVVVRAGYTGERGYELVPDRTAATELWDALLPAAAAYDGRPCGLGARDTLRTEMGFPLHGSDLSMTITPVQARLGWAVGWRKPAFWGREPLLREKEAGAARVLRGLLALDRGIPRPHMPVLSADGGLLGEVTSGTFSPTLRVGVGLALLDRAVAVDDEVQVDVRGRRSRMRVVTPPFVPPSTT